MRGGYMVETLGFVLMLVSWWRGRDEWVDIKWEFAVILVGAALVVIGCGLRAGG